MKIAGMKFLTGARLLWRELDWRKQLVIEALAVMWANVAWVDGLHLWQMISKTRAAELGFCGGTLAGLLLMTAWYWRRLRPRILAELVEASSGLASRASRAESTPSTPCAVRRGGFGARGRRGR
jgi:glucose dehydrogenase